MLAHKAQDNIADYFPVQSCSWVEATIAQVIFLCNVGSGRSRQHCIGYFSVKACLCTLGQHCTSNLQCCAMLHQMYLDNIDWATFLCNVVPAWSIQHCTGYFLHKSCILAIGQHCTVSLSNVGPDRSRQHCTGKNHLQCCLNTLGTTLHRKKSSSIRDIYRI